MVGLLRLPAGTLRTALDLAAVGLGLAIVFWPQRLGLLGIRGTAADADATLRRASAWLRDAAHDRAAAGPIAASLAPDAFPLPSDEWAVAASLFRLAIRNAVLGDARSSSAQASAARGWWRAATERNLLGPRFRPRPFDEQMALRAAYEQYIALVPLQALAPDALVPVGGWDAEAEQVIERCASAATADAPGHRGACRAVGDDARPPPTRARRPLPGGVRPPGRVGDPHAAGVGRAGGDARRGAQSRAARCSAAMIVTTCGKPAGASGMIEASTTCRPSTPWTRPR